jgi:hypothetical protein
MGLGPAVGYLPTPAGSLPWGHCAHLLAGVGGGAEALSTSTYFLDSSGQTSTHRFYLGKTGLIAKLLKNLK